MDIDVIGQFMNAHTNLNEFVIWTNLFIKFQVDILQ